MTVEAKPSAIVIGAGIVGVATAEWLRRAGQDVLLIDRDEPGQATSYGNAGVLARCAVVPVPTPGILAKIPKMLLDPDQPLFLRWAHLPKMLPWLVPYLASARPERVRAIAAGLAPLLWDTVEQHLALARGTPAERWVQPGDYIYLYRDRKAFEADGFAWALRQEHDIDGEPMTRADLDDLDPALGPSYGFGFRMANHGHILNPGRYVGDLAAWFRDQGGRLLRAEVTDVIPGTSGARVIAGGETYDADSVVLASGVWSTRLAARLGHPAKLESERGYHIEYKGSTAVPKCPYMVADGKFVATPMADALRVAGVVELGGTEAGPSRGPYGLLERGIRRLYPEFDYTEKREWMGHRPSTADSLPMLGRSPRSPGIYFAFGHQHVGLTAGPKSGRLIAELIAGRTPNLSLEPYRLDRFS